jgi:hypothetical protein
LLQQQKEQTRQNDDNSTGIEKTFNGFSPDLV